MNSLKSTFTKKENSALNFIPAPQKKGTVTAFKGAVNTHPRNQTSQEYQLLMNEFRRRFSTTLAEQLFMYQDDNELIGKPKAAFKLEGGKSPKWVSIKDDSLYTFFARCCHRLHMKSQEATQFLRILYDIAHSTTSLDGAELSDDNSHFVLAGTSSANGRLNGKKTQKAIKAFLDNERKLFPEITDDELLRAFSEHATKHYTDFYRTEAIKNLGIGRYFNKYKNDELGK